MLCEILKKVIILNNIKFMFLMVTKFVTVKEIERLYIMFS
jgi:hypothetical protein